MLYNRLPNLKKVDDRSKNSQLVINLLNIFNICYSCENHSDEYYFFFVLCFYICWGNRNTMSLLSEPEYWMKP